jgi:hypothetical protein
MSNIVLIEEEFGYRRWIWETTLKERELFNLWIRTDFNRFYFYPPNIKYGNWKEAKTQKEFISFFKMWDSKKYIKGHVFDNINSYLLTPKGRIVFSRHKNEEELMILRDLQNCTNKTIHTFEA